MIKTLVAIADHRSFQAAASVLEMSISNVSLQVHAIESHLGVRLFDRGFRPPRLTEAGVDFVKRSREMLVVWDSLGNSISQGGEFGTLKVGAVHTAVAGGVAVALGRLRQHEPGLFIQLHTELTLELIRSLQNHSIDCAIVTEPSNILANIHFSPIAREELGVIAHVDCEGDNALEVLRRNPYLRFNRHATLSQHIESELKQRNVSIDPTMEITTLDAVESLVMNGLGVSIVPIGKHVRALSNNVKSISFGLPKMYRTLGLMVREDCPRMHLVDRLIAELKHVYYSSEN